MSEERSERRSISKGSYCLLLLTLGLVLLFTPTTAQEKVVQSSQLIRHNRHGSQVRAMGQDHVSTVVEHSIATNAVTVVQQQSEEGHRELRATDYLDFNVGDSMDRLFSTPMDEWTIGQWLFGVFLLSLILWCCGCLACSRGGGRRYYRRSYYNNYRNDGNDGGGGGCCACLRNILLCFCCYEICCDDGEHLPFLNGGGDFA
jgi:hypothetical protein